MALDTTRTPRYNNHVGDAVLAACGLRGKDHEVRFERLVRAGEDWRAVGGSGPAGQQDVAVARKERESTARQRGVAVTTS